MAHHPAIPHAHLIPCLLVLIAWGEESRERDEERFRTRVLLGEVSFPQHAVEVFGLFLRECLLEEEERRVSRDLFGYVREK